METKYFSGSIIEYKENQRNGQPVGIVRGYIATWDVDRGNDQFIKGCFVESLQEHRTKNRQIRLKDNHGVVIGGFPIDTVMEDDRGLIGSGEINLVKQAGVELYSLVRQGVITDFSIGYTVRNFSFIDNVRQITNSVIWEGSLVDEPMNERANVVEVKLYNNMPKKFADFFYKWDSTGAEKRVRQWAGVEEEPNENYKNAFLWCDSDNDEKFESYKLQIVDIINDEPVIVPRAVFAVRAALSGARADVDISENDLKKIKRTINNIYLDMNMEEPFGEKTIKSFCLTELKSLPQSDLRRVIQYCQLSKDAAVFVANAMTDRVLVNSCGVNSDEEKALNDLFLKIKNFEVKKYE